MVKQVLKITRGWRFDAVSIGYPGVVHRGKPAREPLQPGSGLGRLRFSGRVRSPGQDHQRRGDAGARRLQGRKDALPGTGHGPRIGAHRRRRDRADGAGAPALLEAVQLRRLSRPAGAQASGKQEMARHGGGGRARFPQGAAARLHRAGRRQRRACEAAAAAHRPRRQFRRFRGRLSPVGGSITRESERMQAPDDIVFLLDVDNTLLDNDRVQRRPATRISSASSAPQSRDRYWAIFETLRAELGYADYLGALQRYRARASMQRSAACCRCRRSWWTIRSPSGSIRGALDVIAHLRASGPTVILSDGDVVFQPRKVQRSGLWDAVEGRVLIYIHKEQMLDDVERRYPARHYVMVDDKLRILAAMKTILGDRLTTVFPRQGHYAHDPQMLAAYPPRRHDRRAHRRPARLRSRHAARRAQPDQETTMNADPTTARARPEPLARQHHPRAARQRHAARATSTSSRSPG